MRTGAGTEAAQTSAWFAMTTKIRVQEKTNMLTTLAQKTIYERLCFPHLEPSVCLQSSLLLLERGCCSETKADGVFATSGKTWHLWLGSPQF